MEREDEIEFYVEWSRQFSSRGTRKAGDVVSRRAESRDDIQRYRMLMHSSPSLFIPLSRSLSPQKGATFSHAPRRLISLNATATEFLRPIELSGQTFFHFPFRFLPEEAACGHPFTPPLSLSLFPRVHFRFDGENRSIK